MCMLCFKVPGLKLELFDLFRTGRDLYDNEP